MSATRPPYECYSTDYRDPALYPVPCSSCAACKQNRIWLAGHTAGLAEGARAERERIIADIRSLSADCRCGNVEPEALIKYIAARAPESMYLEEKKEAE